MTGNELYEFVTKNRDTGAVVRQVFAEVPPRYHNLITTVLRLGLLVGYGRGVADTTTPKATSVILQVNDDVLEAISHAESVEETTKAEVKP